MFFQPRLNNNDYKLLFVRDIKNLEMSYLRLKIDQIGTELLSY